MRVCYFHQTKTCRHHKGRGSGSNDDCPGLHITVPKAEFDLMEAPQRWRPAQKRSASAGRGDRGKGKGKGDTSNPNSRPASPAPVQKVKYCAEFAKTGKCPKNERGEDCLKMHASQKAIDDANAKKSKAVAKAKAKAGQ